MPSYRHLTAFTALASAASAAWPHAAGVHALSSLSAAWHPDPWISGSLLLAACLYAIGFFRLRRRARHGAGVSTSAAACHVGGLAFLVLALLSPVDTLGSDLFSMHMLQHELMMLAAAPLLVTGSPLAVYLWAYPRGPRQALAGLARAGTVRSCWHWLTAPLPAWLLHALVLWVWHFPSLFQASLRNDALHTAQHLSFLISALLFWSSLTGPLAWPRARLRQGTAVIYILSTAIHTGILGALLTFSARLWYPWYDGRTAAWGLSALEDQQLGGLIMWVPAGFVFLFTGLLAAAKAIAPPPGELTASPPARTDAGQAGSPAAGGTR